MLKVNPATNFFELNPIELPKTAFAQIPYIGNYCLVIALMIFAYTTILGWFCYGRQAIFYLAGKKTFFVFKIAFVILTFTGAVVKLDLVWTISDIANGLMAIPNLIALVALSGVIVFETRRYLWCNQLNLIDEDCANINNKGKEASTETTN
jgi:AGCS family alanine or glycine:cation symporter